MSILMVATRLLRESDGFRVDTGRLALDAPMPAGASLQFGIQGGARLFASPEEISGRPELFPLVLEVNGAAHAALAWSGTSLGLGANSSYRYVRAVPRVLPIDKLLAQYFAAARLPDQIAEPLAPGESIALDYGGYLHIGAALPFGYSLAGAADFQMVGKIGLAAGIAGQFSLVLTEAEGLPGWARVQVKRQHSRDFGVAADVNVKLEPGRDMLPPNAGAFLADLAGVDPAAFHTIIRNFKDLTTLQAFRQQIADPRLRTIVEKLTGRALDSAKELKQAFERVQAVAKTIDTFPDRVYQRFREAACLSWNVALHAGYSRSTEANALLDLNINLDAPAGKHLMAAAGRGDFRELLTTRHHGLVRLNEGVFTRRTQRETQFKITLKGFTAQCLDRVITEVEQRVHPTAQGLVVDTAARLGISKERRRNDESTHVHFLLKALGHSKGLVQASPEATRFLIDSLSSLGAQYQLRFTDRDTSPEELAEYLAFARDIGLDRYGATFENVTPMLPRAANGNFGAIQISYEVRFGARAVQALLSLQDLTAHQQSQLRDALRRQVLVNYHRGSSLHDVARKYSSGSIYQQYKSLGFAAFAQQHGQQVTTLFAIEDALIQAVQRLYQVLGSTEPIGPNEFEKRLSKFGDALTLYDRFDQTSDRHGIGTNSIFFVFDTLIRLASSRQDPANIGILRIVSGTGQASREMAFLTPEAAATA